MLRPLALILTLAWASTLAVGQDASKLLRFPDLHGDRVVFCHGGDLWTASTGGGTAQRLTSHPGLELFPRFSPDGKWIAFTGQIDGDEQVYVIPAKGGAPRQLTFYPARGPLPERWGYDHQVLGWTPNGRRVLFRGFREAWTLSGPRLYTVSVDGGVPAALPMPSGGTASFAPDGRRLAYSPLFRDFRAWKRYEGGWAQDLWIFDTRSNAATNITDHPRTDRDPMWIGDRIYYCSDRSGTLNLYSYDPDTRRTEQETLGDTWDVRWPAKAGPGDPRIVFEQAGGLVVFDTKTRSSQAVRVRVPSEGLARRPHRLSVGDQIADYGLSPKGERAVFSAHGDVFSAPIEHGPTLNLTNSPGAHDRLPTWSPDGRHIAYVSDAEVGEEHVWIVAATGEGEPERLTKGMETRITSLSWSPKGTYLSFGDKDGILRVLEVEGRTLQTVADEPRGPLRNATWSPWSEDYIAYTLTGKNALRAVHIWDRRTGQSVRVSPEYADDFSPAWDRDGKRLFFLGTRSWSPRIGNLEWNYSIDRQVGVFALSLRGDVGPLLPPRADTVSVAAEDDKSSPDRETTEPAAATPSSPEVERIEFEGLAGRVEQLPLPLENHVGLAAVPSGLMVIEGSPFYYGRDSGGSTRLHHFDFAKRETTELVDGLGGLAISRDRTKMLWRQGGRFLLGPTNAGAGSDQKTVSTAELVVHRIPAQEWRQIFHEVWRRFRDYFYAENMHGHDWEDLRQRYEFLLEHCHHRADLNYVISEMIAELNVGHAYISGGDWERPSRPATGLLGARIELDEPTGRYRITAILPGDNSDPRYRSPLTEIGVDVKAGMFLLAIDGHELRPDESPYRRLQHRGKHPVRLTVHTSPSFQGSREVAVRPIASEQALHYHAWVESRRAEVSRLSGGRLGYLHVPDMGGTGLREFIKWFYPQLHKEGLVVDVRWNGGGNISQMLIERLRRELLMGTFGRTTGYRPYPATTYSGHLVCLLNENSASDGDIFPAMFRRAGLGKLVGRRSWGGIIGITNRGNLIDGGVVNVPEFGNTELDGEWTIEGVGVSPDIEVENPPTDVLAGRDPQLERGVKELLDLLKQDPRSPPERPADPIRTGR